MCKGNKGVGVLCSLQTGEPSTVNVGSAAMHTLLHGLQSVLSVVNTDILIYLTVSQTEKHYCHIWSLCTSTLLKVFVCVKSTGCFWTHNCRKEMQTDTKPLWIIPAFKVVTLLICDYFSCGGFNRKKKKNPTKNSSYLTVVDPCLTESSVTKPVGYLKCELAVADPLAVEVRWWGPPLH